MGYALKTPIAAVCVVVILIGAYGGLSLYKDRQYQEKSAELARASLSLQLALENDVCKSAKSALDRGATINQVNNAMRGSISVSACIRRGIVPKYYQN